ncbi:hypothetical protein HPP92_013734 [Vanilla planifolia]|uniref:Hexosyltransferase n=1 Tax=Vanilla planifolia TaxID=51239 RepID=A0A835QS91_VANPL|nr:hypothetical protein HPP92_013734 [Vanilla planifolia]
MARHPLAALILAAAVGLIIAAVGINATPNLKLPGFREAPAFRNGRVCADAPMIHVAMTLDTTYLRGSLAGVLSILQHTSCPENVTFHFIAIAPFHLLRRTVEASFPSLPFRIYRFDAAVVRGKISSSVRRALDQPLNYARIYLADLLPGAVCRVIYFDSDIVVVDDVSRLWGINLGHHTLGAPEYCHANFTTYFTDRFWSDPDFPRAFSGRGRRPCYFNTGVMVMDLEKWRAGGYTRRLEGWMAVQKKAVRIYELGSLPPFLLVFAGEARGVDGGSEESREDLRAGLAAALPTGFAGEVKGWSIVGISTASEGTMWKAFAAICIRGR